MTLAGCSLIALFTILFVALAKPAGDWMHALYVRPSMPGESGLSDARR